MNELSDLADRIYDTLMGNVGVSEFHVGFDEVPLSFQEVNASSGIITFIRADTGHAFRLILEEIDPGTVDLPF